MARGREKRIQFVSADDKGRLPVASNFLMLFSKHKKRRLQYNQNNQREKEGEKNCTFTNWTDTQNNIGIGQNYLPSTVTITDQK